MWNNIGNASAVATLVLFVFYFLGHIWHIKVEKKDLYEKIEVQGLLTEDEDLDVIYVNGKEIIKVVSEKYLNWIKIYPAKYENGQLKKDGKKPIIKVENINRNTPRYFGFTIPEGIPNTIIEYQRSDYIVGTFVVRFDGRGTGYTADEFEVRDTLKSRLYYILS